MASDETPGQTVLLCVFFSHSTNFYTTFSTDKCTMAYLFCNLSFIESQHLHNSGGEARSLPFQPSGSWVSLIRCSACMSSVDPTAVSFNFSLPVHSHGAKPHDKVDG